MDQRTITAAVFAPLTADHNLILSYIHWYQLPSEYHLQPWDAEWNASLLLNKLSIWFPPPELARQAITFMLAAWVQCPATTSALFFVPRVIPGFWFGLSRHIQELEPTKPLEFALVQQPLLPIPVIVLHLAPHIRTLSSFQRRLDASTRPKGFKWHRTQAEYLRELPPSSLSPDKYLLRCAFAHSGFTLPPGARMTPCYSSYHSR